MANISVNINQEITSFAGNNSPVVLFYGMKNTLGLANEGELIQINGETTITDKFGADSHIAQALRKAITINDLKYFLGSDSVKTYAIAVNENASGTADSRTLTFGGSITTASEITISVYDYVDYKQTFTILATDTKTTMASKVKTAFDAIVNFPFTITLSGTDSEILTFTSNVKGGVFKNFFIKVENSSIELTTTIGSAINGATLPLAATIKSHLKNVLDNSNFRFWSVVIEPAFLAADNTLYDLIASYKNNMNVAKQTMLYSVKYDTSANLITFLANYNSANVNFSVQSTLTSSTAKGGNLISEFNMASIIASCYARKDTNNATVNDLGIQGTGSIGNIPLSITDYILPYCNIQSEFTQDDINALIDKNCGIIWKPNGRNYVSLLSGTPDHRTTLTTLTSGANASYKYVGDINNQAYCQDYLQTAFKQIDFFKKTLTSQNIKNNNQNNNQINKERAINLIIYRIRELAELELIAYSDEVEERLVNELNSSRGVIISYINRSITGSSGIEFIKELLNVIFNIVPLTSYNNN